MRLDREMQLEDTTLNELRLQGRTASMIASTAFAHPTLPSTFANGPIGHPLANSTPLGEQTSNEKIAANSVNGTENETKRVNVRKMQSEGSFGQGVFGDSEMWNMLRPVLLHPHWFTSS